MDTYLNNLRIIDIKIKSCMEQGDKDGIRIWKEASEFEIKRIQQYIREIDRPISYLAQLYKNGLELPN